MSSYTLVFSDDLEAEIQRELQQLLRESPFFTANQLVQRYAEQHWRNRAFDTKEQQRHDLTEAILKASPETVAKVRSNLGLA